MLDADERGEECISIPPTPQRPVPHLMEVLVYPDPILRRGGKTITQFDGELRRLAAEMLEAMYDEGGDRKAHV